MHITWYVPDGGHASVLACRLLLAEQTRQGLATGFMGLTRHASSSVLIKQSVVPADMHMDDYQ